MRLGRTCGLALTSSFVQRLDMTMYSVFCILNSVFCDSEEGTAAAGSSAWRVCAGVLVVEATPDTEVDVDVDSGRQEYRIQNTEYRIHCHVKPLQKATC